MRTKTFLLVIVVALAAALAACGGEAIPGETTAPTAAAAPSLVPAFGADGEVLHEAETDLTICVAHEGDFETGGVAPAFSDEGSVLRCPATGAPLYRAERGGEPVLVRVGR